LKYNFAEKTNISKQNLITHPPVQSASSSGSEWSHGDERAEVNSESIVYIKSGE